MNDIYARRAAKTMMFQQAQRALPTLWAATKVTKEKLDGNFVAEEFMRINGQRTGPLLIGAVAQQTQHNAHWVHLHDTGAWAESHRAYAVRHHTPMTQRFADIARLHDSTGNVRVQATPQSLMLEHVARVEGIATFEERIIEDAEDGEDE